MIFPFPRYEEIKEDKYLLKSFDGNYDLMHIYNKYKNGNSEIEFIKNDSYGTDQYDISVNENGIKITHLGECGIFRALTSLKQLIKKYGGELPCCEIKDFPDFEKRGFMLDISRGKVPKVEVITRWIDMLAELKYNEFQLYIENFVVNYKAYPQCTEDFECLSTDDLEFLDNYCKERFIDFVPNQNSLGHMKVWLEREEFKHLKIGAEAGVPSTTLNPLLPESFEFMKNIYESLLPHFSSGFVNVGLDEAHELDKYELEEVCKDYGKDNVFMDWLVNISTHIKEKYNKKIQFWADMVYKYPEAYKRVPKDATALVWGYDIIPTTLYEERCRSVAEKGCDFYVCPGDQTWKSITGRFDTLALNLRKAADAGKRYKAKGYLLTNWGNIGTIQFPLWSYVPLALASVYSWNGGEFSHFMTRTTNFKEAQKYVDEEIFGAPLSEHLRRLQRYYLLEPEMVHDKTIGYTSLISPIDKNLIIDEFNLYEYGDNFYFDNVIEYVEKILKDINNLDIDPELKSQIICNSKMVILAQKFNKLRLDNKSENIDELIELIDYITETFDNLWEKENYSKGKEIFLTEMKLRKEELLKIKNTL